MPFIQYKGFTDNQNHIMRELAQEVLTVSKDENDSNKVAITCDLGVDNPLEVYSVSFGMEHEVDVRAGTLSNHILVSQKSVAEGSISVKLWRYVPFCMEYIYRKS